MTVGGRAYFSARYLRYMGSKTWATRRARYFRTHARQCRACGAKPPEHIQLHHLTYERLGAERNMDLCALCQSCHQAVHKLARQRRIELWAATLVVIRRRSCNPKAALVGWPSPVVLQGHAKKTTSIRKRPR